MTAQDRRWRYSLAAVAALAFAVRIWNLGLRSLWLDEGDSVGFARMSWPAFLHVLSFREANMAIYYVFLRGWLHLGDSEFFLRFPSVIFGTIAIVATCVFAAKISSRYVGIIAGVLMAFHVLSIRYNQQVRGYALVMMLVAFSWLSYERAVRRGHRRDLAIWILVSALAVYAHFFAALVFVAQLACLLFVPLDAKRRKDFTYATLAFFALLLPLIVVILRMDEDPLSWVHPLGREVFKVFATDFFNGGAVQITIAIVMLLASVAVLVRAPRERRWQVSTAVVGTLLPLLLVVILSAVKPTLIARYMLVVMPSYAITVAMVLAELPRKVGIAMACIVVALGLPLLQQYEREPAWNDFRAAVAYISQRAQPGDALMLWEPLARPAVEYYAQRQPKGRSFPEFIFPGSQRPIVAEDLVAHPVPKEIDALCDKRERIWIIYSVDLPPERYFVWLAFFVRRASQNHRMVSRMVVPGYQGVQVMEFVRR